jgi:hypothetical protein
VVSLEVEVNSKRSGREADGFRGVRDRNHSGGLRSAPATGLEVEVNSKRSGREADGFRGVRDRNPLSRIPICAG